MRTYHEKTLRDNDSQAKTMADLVTPKQLVAIRAIANTNGIHDLETKCRRAHGCLPEELTRKAASAFIDDLKLPEAQQPETLNPYRATTIGNLIQPSQLYWLGVAAESVNMDKEETALALFNCSLYSLTREAGEQMLQYFARVKQNGGAGCQHEHECAAMNCGDAFTCKDALCSSALARYCDTCAIRELGELWEEMSATHPFAGILVKPQPASLGRYEGIEI